MYFYHKLLKLSRNKKLLIMLFIDSLSIIIAILLSFSLRLDYWYWPNSNLYLAIFGVPILAIPIFYKIGVYQIIVRFISYRDFWKLTQAATLYCMMK